MQAEHGRQRVTGSPTIRRLAIALVLLAAMLLPVAGTAQSLVPPPAPAASEETPAEETATELTSAQATAIAELLRDEAAREALIAELERLAAPDAEPGTEAAAAGTGVAEPDISFGRRVAHETQEIAQLVAARAIASWGQLGRATGVFSGLGAFEADLLVEALVDLALVIAATVGLFLVLRLFAMRIYRWMGRKAHPMGVFGTGIIIMAGIVVDAAVVLLAWAGGYALAVLVFGEMGEIGIRQTLYLNAFLAVEMVKVAIRGVLSPSVGELRPVHLSDYAANRMWRMLNVVVSLIGYGQLLVVPIVNDELGYYAGRGISALLLLIALAILAASVVRHRRAVAAWLLGEGNGLRARGFFYGLLRFWHVPVLLYLAGLFLVVVTQPGDVLLPVLWASAKVLIASVIGWMVAGLIGRAIARGIRLPASLHERLPLLERRLNTFVPRALFVLRLFVLLAVVAYALDALGIVDVGLWLKGETGSWLTATLVSVVLILLLSFALWLALTSWVDYRLNPEWGSAPTSRESTLLSLLRNAATVALIVITLMFVLSEIGLDIAPLLASAGVIGLAIGFGSQRLVQDVITGIFIQLENAMNVGDVVTVANTSGVVERLTVRSVSLRDVQGVYHVIPFSSVDMVSNSMREFAFFVADIGIAYRESVDEAKGAMFDAFAELKSNPAFGPSIIGDLQWFGVEAFGESQVTVRGRIKTLPGQQWGVGRAYNEIIKRIFDERGIDMPFPHRTLFFGETKPGEAPRAHIALSADPPKTKPK
jgi:moderate conductance mechanosensitive channel